jgi:hypothetical protein
MKAGLCVLVLLLVGGIAALVWHSGREKERAQQQVVAAQSEAQAVQAELKQSRLREKELASLPPQIVVKTNLPRTVEAQPVVAPSKAAPNAAMLKDPETRALMRKQQEQQIAKWADKMISPEFAKTWNLTPEQVKQAKVFFAERGGAGKDLLSAMMFDGLDDDALAQRGRETKQRVDSAEAGLREVLGADGFSALTEQERAHQDSDLVKRMREDIASSGEPLTKEQQAALVAAFTVERQGFPLRVDFGDVSKIDFEHPRDYFSEQNLQMYFEDMQQLNARIAERAALFLSAGQLEQFKNAQNNRLDQGRLTVKMTTELFNKRRGN